MSKIKVAVDFNFKFKGPDGKEISSVDPANKVLSGLLFNGQSPKESKRRNTEWSEKLLMDGVLELEPREMDDILACCDQQGVKDGYYVALDTLFQAKREEWRALYEASKNGV